MSGRTSHEQTRIQESSERTSQRQEGEPGKMENGARTAGVSSARFVVAACCLAPIAITLK